MGEVAERAQKMLEWAEEHGSFRLALDLRSILLREEGKEDDVEHLDLLPEPVAFIDDDAQIRLHTFESVVNACRRWKYEMRKFGTRLDKW